MIPLIRNAPNKGNLFMVRFCDDSKEVMEHLQSGDWLVQDANEDMPHEELEAIIEWAKYCIDNGLAKQV